jgi:hypothetical protein
MSRKTDERSERIVEARLTEQHELRSLASRQQGGEERQMACLMTGEH